MPRPKPNLILTSVLDASWKDQLVIFFSSLESSLGRELLLSQRHTHRHPSPARVDVKIVIPDKIAGVYLPATFVELEKRFPFVEFVGGLPEGKVELQRFTAYTRLVGTQNAKATPDPEAWANIYDKIFVTDLDVVFQRNPFSFPMKKGHSLAFFAEWEGMKIGQCTTNMMWLHSCTPYLISSAEMQYYRPLERICAGTTIGTAQAVAVYLQTMHELLSVSSYTCNDQALHTHLYHSALMNRRLQEAGLKSDGVWLVPNQEALIGTVGWTPIVLYNAWGEVVNEKGEVQVAVHQIKHHDALHNLVRMRYAYGVGEIGTGSHPDWRMRITDRVEEKELDRHGMVRWKFEGVQEGMCAEFPGSGCSCRWKDCQYNYTFFDRPGKPQPQSQSQLEFKLE
ncbi:hypothetical protein SAICODRAFT_53000 [Saitoella complicata NRRL Y-17804]|nr:uncharacterized protein SAICODRAFT_53000 [Saitoella complicata NRRL Y-17804]ODQ55525.1 hypothetical protein SAICODRAFT_53000 [Saitoella complicata NRRL Y-17804]